MTLVVHATTVAIGGRAVLIEGSSGAGKSDLALRLIDRGALLVADDRTALVASEGALLASPPPTIAGLIEVRGLGIVTLPYVTDVPLVLVVAPSATVERMPEPAVRTLADVAVPLIAVDPRAAGAPLVVELALCGVAR